MLDLEYSLVWKAKWNVTKVLYLLARYLPFIDTSLVMYRESVNLTRFVLEQIYCRPTGICALEVNVSKGI